jgi:hypothetical protein
MRALPCGPGLTRSGSREAVCGDDKLRAFLGFAEWGDLWNVGARHSGFAPESFTTFAHFSVSSAISLPKSAGEPSIIGHGDIH